jgi:hypothetical protein
VKAYRNGEQWWLTEDEKRLADEANQPFRMSDPWETPICQYINQFRLDRVTVSDLLSKAIELEIARQDRSAEMRVTGILKQMGWNKSDKRIMLNGIKRYVWLAPDQHTNPPTQPTNQPIDQPDQPDQPVMEVSPEVGQTSNNLLATVSSFSDQPDQPFSPTFYETETKTTEGNREGENFYSQSLESSKKGWSSSEVGQPSGDEVVRVLPTAQPLATNLEPDYSTYPHLTCDTIEAKRNQAHQVKERLLGAGTKEELTAVRKDYSTRCDWVWKNLLTKSQQEKLTEIATTKQLNLLDATLSPVNPIENPPEATEGEVNDQTPRSIQGDTVEPEESGWMSEENIAGFARDLAQCDSAEELDLLRSCWNPQAMNAACKRLSPEKHAQIMQWTIELNQAKPQ